MKNETVIRDNGTTYRQFTKYLIDQYAHKKERFTVNQYAQIVQVDSATGIFNRIKSMSPSQNNESINITQAIEKYKVVTKNFNLRIGDRSEEKVDRKHYEKLACQAMNARTNAVAKELLAPSNYDKSHIVDFMARYNDQSVSSPYDFFRTNVVGEAVNIILRDTLGIVKKENLNLVLRKKIADRLSLPEKICGIRVIRENSVDQTSWPESSAVICSCFDDMVTSNLSTLSTCVIFAKEEMSCEKFDDPLNRLVELVVWETYCVQIVAPASGVLLTNLFLE